MCALTLRIDPWDPEYGASVELEDALEPATGIDLDVELPADAWRAIAPPPLAQRPCCAFIDGVRRVDARLYAAEGDVEAPALAGAWAVGCAWSTRPPRCDAITVGRELVVGGGLTPVDLRCRVGEHLIAFAGRSVPDSGPLDPLRGLQNAMREAEFGLAADIAAGKGADLIVCDGPLGYFASGAILGLVKRQSRSYLGIEQTRVLHALRPGERTPIFKLGEQRLERYSWYLRLAPRRAIDGAMAGVVRLEVATVDGLAAAQHVAGLAGACLPEHAPQPGRDPRAPQNLYPVGALETLLRHRLGDPALVRRAVEVELLREVLA